MNDQKTKHCLNDMSDMLDDEIVQVLNQKYIKHNDLHTYYSTLFICSGKKQKQKINIGQKKCNFPQKINRDNY